MSRMFIICDTIDALRMVERLARGDDCETCPFYDYCDRKGCADTVAKLCNIKPIVEDMEIKTTVATTESSGEVVDWYAEHEPQGPVH